MDFTTTLLNLYKKYGEPALSIASGAAAQIPAGLGGLLTGNPDNVQKIADALRYEPQSPEAKNSLLQIANALSGVKRTLVDENPPVKMAIDGYNSLSDYMGDKSPVLGAAARTLPTALGLLTAPGTAATREAFASGGRGLFELGEQAAKNAAMSRSPNIMMNAQRGSIGIEPKFQYPQQEALETARKNAVDMLGLPENNTAMDRAKSLGFNHNVFHGTNSDIQKFDLAHSGKSSGHERYGMGVYTTTFPETASAYADPSINGANVMPLLVKMDSPITPEMIGSLKKSDISKFIKKSPVIDDALSNYGDIGYEGKDKVLKNATDSIYSYQDDKLLNNLHPIANDFYSGHNQKFNDAAANILKKDGVKVGFDNGENYIIPWSPNQVRSRFAAFDPARINDNDLLGAATPEFLKYLAGGSAAALGAPLAYDAYKKHLEGK